VIKKKRKRKKVTNQVLEIAICGRRILEEGAENGKLEEKAVGRGKSWKRNLQKWLVWVAEMGIGNNREVRSW